MDAAKPSHAYDRVQHTAYILARLMPDRNTKLLDLLTDESISYDNVPAHVSFLLDSFEEFQRQRGVHIPGAETTRILWAMQTGWEFYDSKLNIDFIRWVNVKRGTIQ